MDAKRKRNTVNNNYKKIRLELEIEGRIEDIQTTDRLQY